MSSANIPTLIAEEGTFSAVAIYVVKSVGLRIDPKETPWFSSYEFQKVSLTVTLICLSCTKSAIHNRAFHGTLKTVAFFFFLILCNKYIQINQICFWYCLFLLTLGQQLK